MDWLRKDIGRGNNFVYFWPIRFRLFGFLIQFAGFVLNHNHSSFDETSVFVFFNGSGEESLNSLVVVLDEIMTVTTHSCRGHIRTTIAVR